MRENVVGAKRGRRATMSLALVAWGWLALAPLGSRADRLRSC